MRKIPTLFRRDPDDLKHVLPEITPGCEWVLAGEGVATRKYDGTCVAIRADAMYARREVKPGKQAPADFVHLETDPVTGKSVGWVTVTHGREYDRHWEAYRNSSEGGSARLPDGTYELCGPKVNGNPEGLEIHVLIPHGADEIDSTRLLTLFDYTAEETDRVEAAKQAYEALRIWLLAQPHEGIVWHHPDGRMAKLKRRDFGG